MADWRGICPEFDRLVDELDTPARRRGQFEIRLMRQAEREQKERAPYRFHGSQASFRGTYNENPLESCAYDALQLDPDSNPRGHANFVEGRKGQPGEFKQRRAPKEHLLDAPTGAVRREESRSMTVLTTDRRGNRVPVQTVELKGLGLSPVAFESRNGPRAGPWMQYGKARAPGIEIPAVEETVQTVLPSGKLEISTRVKSANRDKNSPYSQGIGPDSSGGDGMHLRRVNTQRPVDRIDP